MEATLAAAALSVILTTVGTTPVVADDLDSTEGVATLIANVAPFQGKVQQLSATDAGFDYGGVSVPRNEDSPILVPGGDAPLEVSLPAEVSTAPGVPAADGTVVYPSTSGNIDVAAQVLDDGKVRIQAVINGGSGQRELTYRVGGGYTPVEAADGSLWAYKFSEGGDLQIYGIEAPWARDANGAAVSTHYEIRGNSVVQVVSPGDEAAYPIVADPTWEWYSAAYGAGFNKSETRTLASAGGVTGFCALLPGGFAVACGVVGADWFLQAGLAANANGCVFIAVVPAPIAMRYVSANCT